MKLSKKPSWSFTAQYRNTNYQLRPGVENVVFLCEEKYDWEKRPYWTVKAAVSVNGSDHNTNEVFAGILKKMAGEHLEEAPILLEGDLP